MLPRNTKNTWVSVYKSPNFITDFDRVDAFAPLCIQQDQLFLCIRIVSVTLYFSLTHLFGLVLAEVSFHSLHLIAQY